MLAVVSAVLSQQSFLGVNGSANQWRTQCPFVATEFRFNAKHLITAFRPIIFRGLPESKVSNVFMEHYMYLITLVFPSHRAAKCGLLPLRITSIVCRDPCS